MRKIKTHYRRKLPHIHPIGSTFFITALLKNAIPKPILQGMQDAYRLELASIDKNEEEFKEKFDRAWKRHFKTIDDFLDTTSLGEHYLKDDKVAEIVKTQLHRFDGKRYDLIGYSIMSNHFHVVFDTSIQLPELISGEEILPEDYVQVDEIMRRIKGASSKYSNDHLGLEGQFWEHESYDHYARSRSELERIILYTLRNPIKAGLVEDWSDYPHSYYKYG